MLPHCDDASLFVLALPPLPLLSRITLFPSLRWMSNRMRLYSTAMMMNENVKIKKGKRKMEREREENQQDRDREPKEISFWRFLNFDLCSSHSFCFHVCVYVNVCVCVPVVVFLCFLQEYTRRNLLELSDSEPRRNRSVLGKDTCGT